MDETFVEDEGYWHAWDEHRSISLSSIVVADRHGHPVPTHRILEREPSMDGEAVPVPNILPGWARSIETPDSPQADRAVSGILVVDGNILIITVTSDDPDWNRSVWRSIRHHQDGDRPRRLAARRHRR